MKNLKVLVMLFLAATMLSIGCNKDDDETDPGDATYKGSASLTVDGTLHNVLLSDVAEIEEGVTFLIENSTDGTTFQVAIAPAPAVGTTFTFTMDQADDTPILLVVDGPIPDVYALISGSGTIKRTSDKNYEIDAVLFDATNFTDEYPIVGTITVGVVATK